MSDKEIKEVKKSKGTMTLSNGEVKDIVVENIFYTNGDSDVVVHAPALDLDGKNN